MPASLLHLAGEQARNTLLGYVVHSVIVEDPDVPSHLHFILSETEREGDSGDPPMKVSFLCQVKVK